MKPPDDDPDEEVANDNVAPKPLRRGPSLVASCSARRSLVPTITWRRPDAQVVLAKALGQIAADLWLAGRVDLTVAPNVATVGTSDAAHHGRQDEYREAEDRSSGPQAVARGSSR